MQFDLSQVKILKTKDPNPKKKLDASNTTIIKPYFNIGFKVLSILYKLSVPNLHMLKYS